MFKSSNKNVTCFLVLEGPDEIPKSKMSSLEIFLVNGPGCQTKKVWVELTAKFNLRNKVGKLGGLQHTGPNQCKFDFKNGQLKLDGNKVSVKPIDVVRCFGDKYNKFNNVDNLPVFRMGSENGNKFCLKEIKLTTEDGEVYTRTFRHKKTSLIDMYMPMFHPSQTEKLKRDLANTQCPENLGQPGCPRDNIRFNELVPQSDPKSGMYCDFNPKCETVSSDEAETPDSGYLCFKTKDGSYTNYNFCCDVDVPDMPENGIQYCGDLD
jgi:hypothetical protein